VTKESGKKCNDWSALKIDIGKLRVLVVDDYEKIRVALANALRKLGMEPVEAGNGIEALAILAKQEFDLIFTDIVMPEMDGFELCQEIRRKTEYRNLPIVVTSTHADANYIIKALRMGADDYIAKPIEEDLVAKVINRIFTPVIREVGND